MSDAGPHANAATTDAVGTDPVGTDPVGTDALGTDERSLELVRALADEAEAFDGSSPFSDQAVLAVAQGARTALRFSRPGDEPTGPLGIGIFGIVPGEAGPADPAAGDTGVDAAGHRPVAELDLAVRPAARGRGVGRAAFAILLDRLREEAPGAELRAWVHGRQPAAEHLLRGAGFEPARTLYRLALDPTLLPAPGAPAPLPKGFAAVTFDPADTAQAEAWVRVNAAAFAAHPEQGAVTLDDFLALTREPWFSADDLIFAVDPGAGGAAEADVPATGAAVAGFSWIKTVRNGRRTECELYVIGVDPAYAGRGLGGALLGATLARMAEHHPERVTLYVDGDNPAMRLYERAGFAVDTVSTQWRRG